MDFSVPENMRDLLDAVREFVRGELYDAERALAGREFASALPELERLRTRVKERGWWLPQMPESYGGMGLDFREHALLTEIIGSSFIGLYCFGCQAPDAGNMEILHKFGSDEQRRTFLEPLCRGEVRSCFSMTEPDRAGSNPAWMDTRAERVGDEWVINGRKWFTTAADGAAFAIVMAVTNPDAPPYARASMIIVPTDSPGFRHVRRIPIMGEEGSGWDSHSEIEYVDCRVPIGNLLADEGSGFRLAQERLGPGRIHHCMRWIGISERALELMCQRAATREIAPGKALGSQQMVQQWVAESRAQINAARLLVQHAAWRIDREGTRAARDDISCAKFFVADVMQRVLDRAIQTHGALGITEDTPLSRFYRHERGARIYDGPDEVHKAAVARRMLRAHGLEVGAQAEGS